MPGRNRRAARLRTWHSGKRMAGTILPVPVRSEPSGTLATICAARHNSPALPLFRTSAAECTATFSDKPSVDMGVEAVSEQAPLQVLLEALLTGREEERRSPDGARGDKRRA